MKAKGIKSDPYPSWWIREKSLPKARYITNPEERAKKLKNLKRSTYLLHMQNTSALIAKIKFNNSIAATKKPYFFIYRYPKLKKDYTDFLLAKAQQANADSPVIDTPCVMNNICHHMEKHLKSYTLSTIPDLSSYASLLLRDPSFVPSKEQLSQIQVLYEEFQNLRKTHSSYSHLIEQAMQISNGGDIAVYFTYVLNKKNTLSFTWEVFAQPIVQNLYSKIQKIPMLPTISQTETSIDQLFKYYKQIPLTPKQLNSLIEVKYFRVNDTEGEENY